MAHLFQRINDVINANINDLVDKLEDPERMIKQIIREMEDNVLHCKASVVDAITHEKQLKHELNQQQSVVNQWQQKAETALLAGNDDLARLALVNKKQYADGVAQLEAAWIGAKTNSEQLKQQLTALQAKLNEAKHKRSALLARQHASIAQQQMSQTLHQFQHRLDTQNRFERMEDKVSALEARAAALAELEDDQSPVEKAFVQMEIEVEVDAELAALKRQLKQ